MKTLVLTLLFSSLSFFSTRSWAAGPGLTTESLRKEIETMVRHENVSPASTPNQEVQVYFLINARQELVVFEVTGNNPDLCADVKTLLNFKKVNFKNAKQLSPYQVTIRFENGRGVPEPIIRA